MTDSSQACSLRPTGRPQLCNNARILAQVATPIPKKKPAQRAGFLDWNKDTLFSVSSGVSSVLANTDDLQAVRATGLAQRLADGNHDHIALLHQFVLDQRHLGFAQQVLA